jgi:hypothetical protein
VIIREKKDVLVLPERLVTFEDGGKKAFVELAAADPKKRAEESRREDRHLGWTERRDRVRPEEGREGGGEAAEGKLRRRSLSRLSSAQDAQSAQLPHKPATSNSQNAA